MFVALKYVGENTLIHVALAQIVFIQPGQSGIGSRVVMSNHDEFHVELAPSQIAALCAQTATNWTVRMSQTAQQVLATPLEDDAL